MGKPHNVEEFHAFLSRLTTRPAERRVHERYAASLGIRLSRIDPNRLAAELIEETATENLSRGGARVRSRIGGVKGDVVVFEEVTSAFRTRAQIQEITGADRDRYLHLRFLDASAPDTLLALAAH